MKHKRHTRTALYILTTTRSTSNYLVWILRNLTSIRYLSTGDEYSTEHHDAFYNNRDNGMTVLLTNYIQNTNQTTNCTN